TVLKEIISSTFQYGGGGGGFGGIFHIFGGKEKPDVQTGRPVEEAPKPKPGIADILDYLRDKPFFDIIPFNELPPFSRSLGSGKRDLKDFVEKVIKAIDEGKLKDERGKLKEAAQKVLKDGESLTKSYFGRGDHK